LRSAFLHRAAAMARNTPSRKFKLSIGRFTNSLTRKPLA
jgi:hypothetical protein